MFLLYTITGLTKEYVLEPVAAGTPLNEAPLQTTEILNVGEAGVWYFVDEDTIGDANDAQGYGVPVGRTLVYGVVMLDYELRPHRVGVRKTSFLSMLLTKLGVGDLWCHSQDSTSWDMNHCLISKYYANKFGYM